MQIASSADTYLEIRLWSEGASKIIPKIIGHFSSAFRTHFAWDYVTSLGFSKHGQLI